MRRFVLAISMAVLAVAGAMMPATASADTASIQASAEVVTSVADEYDYAVAGTLPPRSQLTCRSNWMGEVCYQEYGDKWWVRDDAVNGASTGVFWENMRDGVLYRSGYCFNSLGAGKWGYCNKNYYEDSALYGMICNWDRNGDGFGVCGPGKHTFQWYS